MATQQPINWGQYIRPIVIGSIILFGWVARYIKTQQQERAAKCAKEQRELESLRTGRIEPRPAPTPARAAPPSAQASLEEIAARRRAKMDEMQRRRAGAQRQTSVGLPPASSDAAKQELGRLLGQVLGVPTNPNPPRGTPGKMGRTPQRRQPPNFQPRPESPQVRSASTPVPSQPEPARQGPSTRSQTSAQRMAQSSQPSFAPAHDQNAPAHDQNAPEFSYAIGAHRSNQANRAASRKHRTSVLKGVDLRRMFILREVFEKPVSMRESEL